LSDLPTPFSPVQRARKFSAVLGTTSLYSSKVIRPAGLVPMEISKKVRLRLGAIVRVEGRVSVQSEAVERRNVVEGKATSREPSKTWVCRLSKLRMKVSPTATA
jgi:hypothetical protein